MAYFEMLTAPFFAKHTFMMIRTRCYLYAILFPGHDAYDEKLTGRKRHFQLPQM